MVFLWCIFQTKSPGHRPCRGFLGGGVGGVLEMQLLLVMLNLEVPMSPLQQLIISACKNTSILVS